MLIAMNYVWANRDRKKWKSSSNKMEKRKAQTSKEQTFKGIGGGKNGIQSGERPRSRLKRAYSLST